LIDRTAHVAALTALIETPTAYRHYLAVYVRDVSPFTPFYMAMIDPSVSKTYRVSVLLARCPCPLESSIRQRLTCRFSTSVLNLYLAQTPAFHATFKNLVGFTALRSRVSETVGLYVMAQTLDPAGVRRE
jgi:hypothetical protein